VNADASETGASDSRNETRTERAPRGEGRRERSEGRRERGGERGERRNEGGRQNVTGENAGNMGNAQAEMPFNTDASTTAVNENAQGTDERQDGTSGSPEKRERRSRDRYGRDRRERNNDNAPAENESNEAARVEAPTTSDAPAPRSYFERGNPQVNAESDSSANLASNTSETKATASTSAPAAAPSQAPAGLPKVQKYELPMASLIQVAEGSGLQWVNSDPQKIAQVQAAIAAEPKPVHVPRERPPAVVFDEGPLILVETRKDLSEMKLPF
jgi:ribonuclease E